MASKPLGGIASCKRHMLVAYTSACLSSHKVIYDAPFSEKNVYHVRVCHDGPGRIGWSVSTTNSSDDDESTNMRRLNVDSPAGVLDPKESVLLAVSCNAFDFASEDTNNDRISLEWVNAPEGAAKTFRCEWFQGDGMVRRKNLPIKFNT